METPPSCGVSSSTAKEPETRRSRHRSARAITSTGEACVDPASRPSRHQQRDARAMPHLDTRRKHRHRISRYPAAATIRRAESSTSTRYFQLPQPPPPPAKKPGVGRRREPRTLSGLVCVRCSGTRATRSPYAYADRYRATAAARLATHAPKDTSGSPRHIPSSPLLPDTHRHEVPGLVYPRQAQMRVSTRRVASDTLLAANAGRGDCFALASGASVR
jgi:hypothetical protein